MRPARDAAVLCCGALIAGLLFASDAEARAEEWRFIAQDGPVRVAVDAGSFGGPDAARTFRSVLIPVEPGDPYAWLVVDATIDCEARTIRGLRISAHDPQGAVLGQRDLPPDINPVSESDGTETVARAACDGEALTGRSFPSLGAFSAWARSAGANP